MVHFSTFITISCMVLTAVAQETSRRLRTGVEDIGALAASSERNEEALHYFAAPTNEAVEEALHYFAAPTNEPAEEALHYFAVPTNEPADALN
jgi:hypothetical protein